MGLINRQTATGILGTVDDETLLALQGTGASLNDLTEAKAILDGKSDIAGQGEQTLPTPVRELLIILRGRAV